MEGRSPPNHPGRPHSIKTQSSDWAFIVLLNEIITGRGPRGAAGRLRPWLTTGSGRGIPPVADHVERRGQAPLRRLFYLGLCRLRGILSPPAPTTVILQSGRSSVQQRCCSRRNHSSLPSRKLVSDAEYRRCHCRCRRNHSSSLQRRLESDAEFVAATAVAGGPFHTAATMVLQ